MTPLPVSEGGGLLQKTATGMGCCWPLLTLGSVWVGFEWLCSPALLAQTLAWQCLDTPFGDPVPVLPRRSLACL